MSAAGRNDGSHGWASLHRAPVPSVLWPGRPAPSAEVEAERGLASLFILLRAGVAVQIVWGSISGVRDSAHPVLYTALACLMVIHVIAISRSTWRAECVLPRAWGWIDLGLTLVAVAGCAFLLPRHLVAGTWESWASGYATGTAAAVGAWCHRHRVAFALTIGIGLVYVLITWSRSTADATTVIGNGMTYPVFGAISIVFSAYWRRLAVSSDAATSAAIAAAEETQTNRYRLMVHDIASILRLLGDEATPPVQLPALRAQATIESRRLRAYLSDTPVTRPALGDGNDLVTLGAAIADATDGFTDLPLDLLIDLGARTPISESTGAAVSAALATLLHNVRVHSHATDVVLHADTRPDAWEIVLTDNGVGFDPATVTYGFGLKRQVLHALHEHDVTAHIHSSPGHGCTITLTGTIPRIAPAPEAP